MLDSPFALSRHFYDVANFERSARAQRRPHARDATRASNIVISFASIALTLFYLFLDVVRHDAVFCYGAHASTVARACDAEQGVMRVRAELHGAHDAF